MANKKKYQAFLSHSFYVDPLLAKSPKQSYRTDRRRLTTERERERERPRPIVGVGAHYYSKRVHTIQLQKYKPTLTCSVSNIYYEFRFEFWVFGFVDDGEEINREWVGFGGAVSEEMLRDGRRRDHGLDHIMESEGWELCHLGRDRVLGPIASQVLQAQQFLKFHEATQHLCTCASCAFLLPPLLLYVLRLLWLWLWRCWFLFWGLIV